MVLLLGREVVKVITTTSLLKLPLVSLVLAKYVNSPKVSIGIDLRAVPAETVTRLSATTKFSTVAACIPDNLFITTSFRSISVSSPSGVRG